MRDVKANILILFLLVTFSVKCQTFIEGQVLDQKTRQPISYANIYIKGTTIGTTTNDTGYYKLKLSSDFDSISAVFLGYNELTNRISNLPKQTINFELSEAENMLVEAVIVASR